MKKILSIVLSLITVSGCFFCGSSVQKNSEVFAEDKNVYDEYIPTQTVYDKLISMKEEYPEGMKWTNENSYSWNGGMYGWGCGCAAFSFTLSDSVFGDLCARKHTDYSHVKVGDIVRVNNDTHSVIVLKKKGSIITVAEGNYNSSIHWGRTIDLSKASSGFTYVLTRYPISGDIDGDNTVNSEDASLVLAEYSALSTSSPSTFDDRKKWASDIDGNGAINADDASLILAFYAYLSTSNDTSQIEIKEWINK